LNKISRKQFFEQIERERQKYNKSQASGGDYYRNVFSRMGVSFTKAVLTEARDGKLLLRDAAKLLGLKVPTFLKLSEQSK
jgi:hypothetical protein